MSERMGGRMTTNATDNLHTFYITDGPNREKLFDALKYSCSNNKSVVKLSVLSFRLNGEVVLQDRDNVRSCHFVREFDARILGLLHCQKRDTQFIVSAQIGKIMPNGRIITKPTIVQFLYDTKSRSGNIQLQKRYLVPNL